ncbi:MAG: murein hydrolase activator EnvC family protein [Dethiobacteria bacterium]|jgi:murein DD-endopeptidase MepM/ murein hydrolase activator NlpD
MRRHKLTLVLAVVLAVLTFTAAVVPVYASTPDQKQLEQQKRGVKRQLRQEQSNLGQQRNREAELKAELNQLDRRLQELQAELEQVNREIAATEEEIARAKEALAEAEAALAEKETLFKRRLRNIYERGYVSYLDVLLGASSFSDFLTRFNNLKIIADNDQRLVDEVRAERDRVEAMKEELEQEKSRLDGMRRQILNNEAELERTRLSRNQVKEELQEEITRSEEAIRKMKLEEEKLEKEIQDLIRRSASNRGAGSGGGGGGAVVRGSGRFCWPAACSFYVPTEGAAYGWRVHPIDQYRDFHRGIDISTAGTIFAADSGRVILAQYNNSYGNYIIIDHGNGFTTLYAHLSVISVRVGQSVSRGQCIGIAGSTGNSTGPHLHFEVRVNGKHTDPMHYL